MSNAIERIKGFCCEVTPTQWEELVRVADEVGVDMQSRKYNGYKFYLLFNDRIFGNADVMGESIPFPDFLAKLRGVEEWTPKAGEMVEVSNDGSKWWAREFIAESRGKFIGWASDDTPCDWNMCRQAMPTITRAEAEQQLGKRIID